MIRLACMVSIILGIFVCMVGPALAIDGGNAANGKQQIVKMCKNCHDEGGAGGKITPLTKTMAQWDRFFLKDRHKDKPGVFEQIPEKVLLDIHQYLYDHAADSNQPQTCG